MEKTIRVTILGREYPLRVDETHETFTRRVATFVDERIQAVERQAPGHPDLTHAVVAAMSLAEELLALQETGRSPSEEAELTEGPAFDALRDLQAQAADLVDRLDAVLGAEEAFDASNPEGVTAVSSSSDAGGAA